MNWLDMWGAALLVLCVLGGPLVCMLAVMTIGG